MREIKFRAWDKKTNQLYPIWDIGFKGWDGQDESIINYIRICIDGTVDRLENEVILMQYTGLKDKEGKMVYEQDIFKDNKGNIGIIEWDYPLLVRLGEIEFEIIGNIYENPNLQKGA